MIEDWLYNEYSFDLPDELINIFERSHIQKRWYGQASLIVHRLSEMPWTTQRELSKKIWLLDGVVIKGVLSNWKIFSDEPEIFTVQIVKVVNSLNS